MGGGASNFGDLGSIDISLGSGLDEKQNGNKAFSMQLYPEAIYWYTLAIIKEREADAKGEKTASREDREQREEEGLAKLF